MIDLDKLATIDELAEALGCCKRTAWTAVDRAGRDEVTVRVLGRVLIKKSKVKLIEQHYYRPGSKRASLASKHYGKLGGTQKGINARKRAAGSGRGGREASS